MTFTHTQELQMKVSSSITFALKDGSFAAALEEVARKREERKKKASEEQAARVAELELYARKKKLQLSLAKSLEDGSFATALQNIATPPSAPEKEEPAEKAPAKPDMKIRAATLEKLRLSLAQSLEDGSFAAALRDSATAKQEETAEPETDHPAPEELRVSAATLEKLRASLTQSLEDGSFAAALHSATAKQEEPAKPEMKKTDPAQEEPRVSAATLEKLRASLAEGLENGHLAEALKATPSSLKKAESTPTPSTEDEETSFEEKSECSAEEVATALETFEAAGALDPEPPKNFPEAAEKEEEKKGTTPVESNDDAAEISKPTVMSLPSEEPAKPSGVVVRGHGQPPRPDGWLRRFLRKTCGALSGRAAQPEE